MNPTSGNYEAFKAVHEARMQSVRASAVAAGLNDRDRRSAGLMRRLAAWMAQRPATQERVAPKASPESLFWA